MVDASKGRGALPTFLLVGAQKSATTSLISYLAGHPQIFALRDEVHFFDREYARGLDWYRQQFAEARGEEAIGESTPEYMYVQHAPPRLARDLPGARLVAILRNPVDRAYAHYWHNRTRGLEPLEFEEALAAEPERLGEEGPSTRGRYSYLGRGRYLRQLKRIREYYSAEALRVVLFEDLRRDRLGVVRSLYKFLGVDDSVIPPTIHLMKNRFVKYRSQRLRRPIRTLPPILRRVASRLNIRYAAYPPLVPEVRQRVGQRFNEENDRLAEWLGIDLAEWNA